MANFKYHIRSGHLNITNSEKECQHPNCVKNFKSLKTKLLHHVKFEPDCEREKNFLVDLVGKFRTTAEYFIKTYDIEKSSILNSKEYQNLKKQYEDTSAVISNKDQFMIIMEGKILNL